MIYLVRQNIGLHLPTFGAGVQVEFSIILYVYIGFIFWRIISRLINIIVDEALISNNGNFRTKHIDTFKLFYMIQKYDDNAYNEDLV